MTSWRRADHHPTFEQYMSLQKNSHHGHDQLVKLWAAGEAGRARSGRGFSTPAQVRGIVELGMLRDSIPDDPAEVQRLIDVTMRDIEMGYFGDPRPELTPLELTGEGVTPCRHCGPVPEGPHDCPLGWGSLRIFPLESSPVAECEPDPKGPLGLRLRLWWMRRRLWWMMVRLDGAREALRGAT